ncbi:MAG: hypothetical protein H0V61_05445 [Chitinophagales bacterium]|nr:hypothetical protein [Chitinophagales bacterium]
MYEDLRKELGFEAKENIDAIATRAKLEVLMARDLYGLNISDWEHMTATFIYGGESETKKELDEIIKLSKEIY